MDIDLGKPLVVEETTMMDDIVHEFLLVISRLPKEACGPHSLAMYCQIGTSHGTRSGPGKGALAHENHSHAFLPGPDGSPKASAPAPDDQNICRCSPIHSWWPIHRYSPFHAIWRPSVVSVRRTFPKHADTPLRHVSSSLPERAQHPHSSGPPRWYCAHKDRWGRRCGDPRPSSCPSRPRVAR